MARACYNPKKSVSFFDKILKISDDRTNFHNEHFPAHLLTHPHPEERRQTLTVCKD
jgi:predicted Zn-dependent protease